MLFIVLLNTISTFYWTNQQIRNPRVKQSSSLKVAELGFMTVYAIEFLLKFVVHCFYIFFNEEMYWNWFDFVIVGLGFIELLIQGSGGELPISPQFARSLRVVRMVEVFRAFRVVGLFKELRLLLRCMAGSLIPLWWSFALLASVSLLFANVFVQLMTAALAEGKLDASDAAEMLDKHTQELANMEELKSIFHSMDLDCLSPLTFAELRESLCDLRIESYLDLLGVDVTALKYFLSCLFRFLIQTRLTWIHV